MNIKETITADLLAALHRVDCEATADGDLFSRWAGQGMPANFTTGQHYSNSNLLTLWDAMDRRNFARNMWLTFKQAQAIGAKVRKGAKGVMCIKVVQGIAGDQEEGELRRFRAIKPFWVFNVAEVDGLPVIADGFEAQHDVDSVLKSILRSGTVTVRYGFDGACYASGAGVDEIRMPNRAQFSSSANFYRAMFHELGHWTGHGSRLGRDMQGGNASASYAFEELVADMTSAFCCARLGVKGAKLEYHAAYAKGYLTVLDNDPAMLVKAAGLADAAYRYLMKLAGFEAESAAAQCPETARD